MVKLIYSLFVIVISLAFAVIVYFLNKKNNERKIYSDEIKKEVPEGLKPEEISCFYFDKVKNEYMNSIILELANAGYLRIEETSLRDFETNSKNYRVTKLKEYDGNDENRKLFFKELFQYGFNGVSVSSSDLYGKIEITTEEVKKTILNEYKDKLFEPLMSGMFIFITIMIIINLLLVFIIPIIVPFEILSFFAGIIGVFSIGAIAFFGKDFRKRTQYGNDISVQIESYKNFLEKEQVNNLLQENPNCFFEILPYAYAIGIDDKWIEKFSNENIQKPEWFQVQNDFNINNIKDFVKFLKILK